MKARMRRVAVVAALALTCAALVSGCCTSGKCGGGKSPAKACCGSCGGK